MRKCEDGKMGGREEQMLVTGYQFKPATSNEGQVFTLTIRKK